jgi:16S rRNA (guanine966-N2)-methyltransferase
MLRITGGQFNGRSIQTPAHQTTRPSHAKLRQALFNSLQTRLPDAKILDLFAGSGALGFEALSRGAASVVFVEEHRAAIKVIDQNAVTLKIKNQTRIIGESVESALPRVKAQAPFDLVLIDPPYAEGWELKLLETWPWDLLLAENGYLCLEWGTQKSVISELPDHFPNLVKVREKNYGDSMLTTFIRAEKQ